MSRITKDIRRHANRILLTTVIGSAVVLTGCGSGPANEATSERGETTTPPVATDHEAAAPPTTNAQGGFGLPEAEEITSLGIEGVTEVTFPETCEIEFVALDAAIGFTAGSAVVSPEGEDNLAMIARERLDGAESVAIVGHTSSEGDLGFNQRLSEDRAATVRAVLEPLVPGATFTSEGRGPSELISTSDGTEDRVASRRVVITAQVPEETCSAFGS